MAVIEVINVCLLMSVLVSHAMCGCQDDCLCRHELGSLKCDCSSSNFTCAVSHLSSSLTSLHFTTLGEEKKEPIHLENAMLSRFTNLTHLSITTPNPEREDGFTDLHGLSRPDTFQGLDNLKTLRINVLISSSTAPLHKMLFAPLRSLEELDLSGTQMIHLLELRDTFINMTTPFLRKLKIRNVQANTHNPYFSVNLNVSWYLEPLQRMPLEVFDFSRNAFLIVLPGLLRHKHLKEVYFHENFIRETSFYTEVFIHPSLEMVVGSYQGCPGDSDNRRLSYRDWMERLDSMNGKPQLADELSDKIAFATPGNHSVGQKSPRKKRPNSPPKGTGKLMCQFLSSTELGKFPFFDRISCDDFPDYLLEAADASCINEIRLPIGPNLRELHFTHFSFYQGGYGHPMNGSYCFSSDNNLRLLDFANLGMWGRLLADTINNLLLDGLTKLEILNLENSGVRLWNTQFFRGGPNLKVLILAGNTVSLENDTNAEFFANNGQLQELNLANTGLSMIHSNTFSHLDRLRVLDLSDNKLTNISFALPMSGHMQELLLQKNGIQTVTPDMRKQLDKIARHSAVTVDLSDNPLLCACTDTGFIKWMQTTRVNFRDGNSYQCHGAQTGINLIMNIHLEELDSLCNPSYVVVICASVLSTLGVVGVCLAGFTLYRKRYSIMHWKYIRFTRPKLTFDENVSFKYDAFIVYNSDDKWWTHHALLAEMEERRQLKLCIYLRDFPAGGAYADVIDDAMQTSRKTVLILSPKFFASNWCLHEMSMAHNKLVAEGVDLTELVILSPLSSDVMTSTLTQLMQNKLALNWTEDPDGQKLFWDKFEDAIRSPRLFPNTF